MCISSPRFKASFVLVLTLCHGFLLGGPSHAQGIQFGDTNEWSSFALPPLQAPRNGPVLDVAFQDVKQDGPWSRTAEARLGEAEIRLFALLKGAQWGEALAHLKKMQPDLNRRDEMGATPLSWVARAGQMDLLKEMLRQGADTDVVGAGGLTPLGAAAFGGHELIVRELLRKQARTDVPMSTGQYPLHLACATGQVNIVRQLLSAGADWRLPNRQGRHAVSEAAYFGQVGALRALRESGADLAAPDLYRLNAVHAAALGVQPDALAWLQTQGVPMPSIFSQLLIDQWPQGELRTP